MSSAAPKVLIADDDARAREALARAIRASGMDVAEVNSGELALAHIGRQPTDVLVADIEMPGNRELELLQHEELRTNHVRTVLITGYASLASAVRAVGAQASGYLIKPFEIPELVEAIRTAYQEAQKSRTQERLLREVRALLDLNRERPTGFRRIGALTDREHEIVTLFAQGLSIPQVGRRLFIAPSTVRNHLRSIYRKLGVTRQSELVAKVLSPEPQ